jgi:hypothetical protein
MLHRCAHFCFEAGQLLLLMLLLRSCSTAITITAVSDWSATTDALVTNTAAALPPSYSTQQINTDTATATVATVASAA